MDCLQKFMVNQLAKKIFLLSRNRKIIYCVHKSLSLNTNITQLNPFHNLIYYSYKFYFNIIILFALTTLKRPQPF